MLLNGQEVKLTEMPRFVNDNRGFGVCVKVINEETQEETEEFIRLAKTQKNMKIVAE